MGNLFFAKFFQKLDNTKTGWFNELRGALNSYFSLNENFCLNIIKISSFCFSSTEIGSKTVGSRENQV
jgi:hypothetical protein